MSWIKDFIKNFKKGQKMFADDIAIIINSILLSIVYIFGVGISAIFARIFDKKFMDKKPNINAKTYWEPLNLKKAKTEEYYRQF